MKNVKPTPRHRKARRPLAPVVDLAEAITTSVGPYAARGIAGASVTGLALTAAVTMTANAAPVTTQPAKPAPAAVISTQPTTFSTADIAWSEDALLDQSATAEAPEPEVTATAPGQQVTVAGQAASRDAVRDAIPAPSGETSAAVSIALQFLGVPYVYGGSSPAGFDCSGLTQYVYAQLGISLPREAVAQGYAGTFIPASEARPGDLVWHSYGHVGIYAGNGMVIEATTPGDVVKMQGLWGSYQFVRL